MVWKGVLLAENHILSVARSQQSITSGHRHASKIDRPTGSVLRVRYCQSMMVYPCIVASNTR